MDNIRTAAFKTLSAYHRTLLPDKLSETMKDRESLIAAFSDLSLGGYEPEAFLHGRDDRVRRCAPERCLETKVGNYWVIIIPHTVPGAQHPAIIGAACGTKYGGYFAAAGHHAQSSLFHRHSGSPLTARRSVDYAARDLAQRLGLPFPGSADPVQDLKKL